jgi:HlyD family secretion protein
MKKLIVSLVIIGLLAGGYFAIKKYGRMQLAVFRGEIKPATRGDLVVPITASGYIKPLSITQIKSKASGEVTDLPVNIGAMVRKGQLLIQLLEIYEKRNLEQAEVTHERAQIALEQAKLALEQRQGPAIKLGKAKLESVQARQIKAGIDYKWHRKMLTDGGMENPDEFLKPDYLGGWKEDAMTREEWMGYGTAKLDADAAVMAAEAELRQAEIAAKSAEEDVKNAEATGTGTDAALKDAQQRFADTTILSPVDGMVLTRPVQKGEVVSSAQTTFTGGTPLMDIADISEIYALVNVDEADIGQVHELAPASARPGTATQPTTRPVGAEASVRPAAPLATLPADTFDHGQIVKVKVESFPDEDFEGVITQISPQSEVVQAVATFKVWIRITSPNVKKLVGLLNTQAEAHFTARSVHNAVLVPYDAVQKNPNGEGYGVYVPVPVAQPGTGGVEPKFVPCKFGADNGLDIEVRSGIQEGQRVYTKLPLKRDEQK